MDVKCTEGSTAALQKNYSSINMKPPSVQGPTDRHGLVRITMYLCGIACLLPWNFFIQANDYWMYKFRNVTVKNSSSVETELQATFPSYLAIASKVPYVLFLLVNTLIANRFSSIKRFQIPLLVMITLFTITVILVPVNTDYHQTAFFIATICIVIAINILPMLVLISCSKIVLVMCGFLQGAGTGIAGSFPKEYMGYNVNGMAIGGLLASFAQVASLAGDTTSIQSAIIYFVLAIVILCLTFVFFRIAVKTDFYQYHMSKQISTNEIAFTNNAQMSLSIFKKVWMYAVSITLIFWVTLCVLPAVMVLISSTSESKTIWTGRLFIPIAFFVFNACDLGGRMLAFRIKIVTTGKIAREYPSFWTHQSFTIDEGLLLTRWKALPSRYCYVTMALTIARVGFIPLIMLCNANPRSHLPVVFDSDASFIAIIFFFAITNGYLANNILMQAPKRVPEECQELAGSQMAFFLGLGLMLGSVTSYGIVKAL